MQNTVYQLARKTSFVSPEWVKTVHIVHYKLQKSKEGESLVSTSCFLFGNVVWTSIVCKSLVLTLLSCQASNSNVNHTVILDDVDRARER